jgi:hypothetical protein
MKSEVKGTMRYEERGQGYRDIEKVGEHWYKPLWLTNYLE